jgi:hypothetical protein
MENTVLHTHTLLPIEEIARKLSLLPAEYEAIGTYGAKLRLELLENPALPIRGKLIIVTATTPTTSGEGKTVVSIGLAQGLERETGAVLRANESSKWAAPFTPTLTSNFPKYANFGEGKTDWKKMMTELKKAGVKQTFIEQDGTASNDELGAVRQAYDYLLKV